MAKLDAYYTLCPLIDQQNLLGVDKDSETGCVIVTLGKNIIIRYKLQDLKQISSWSSKERITSQVIYDRSLDLYAAIFNERKVRVWSCDETDLNNVKGYKFNHPFYTILSYSDLPSVLVLQNGATASLEWALKNRKSWSHDGILKQNEKLLDCQLVNLNGSINLYSLTKVEDVYHYVIVPLEHQTSLPNLNHIRRIELKRTSEDLVGHVVMQKQNNAYLLTLWSHGRLYSHSLVKTPLDPNASTLISVITNINTKHPVVMVSLNETTIAAYGADIAEEGAILMIYNVQFKLIQAAQKLKLYTRDAKLWRVEDKLLLAANRHLAIAPYHLAPQRIAAMLGSSLCFKDNDKNDEDVVVIEESMIAQWEDKEPHLIKLPTDRLSKSIIKQLSSYINEGLSDAAIHNALIPQLIECKDIIAIIWCLDTLNDLPEKLLIDLLAFSLRTSDETFTPLQNGTSNCDVKETNIYSRNAFLDKIFSIAYSDIYLLSYLKTELKFDEILTLLNYLIHKLSTEEDSLNCVSQPTNKQLYDWFNLLLDSHYQHYVLSQDSDVSILLHKMNLVLDNHFQLLKDMENLRPILCRIINGKSLKPSIKNNNKFYSIEEIKLY